MACWLPASVSWKTHIEGVSMCVLSLSSMYTAPVFWINAVCRTTPLSPGELPDMGPADSMVLVAMSAILEHLLVFPHSTASFAILVMLSIIFNQQWFEPMICLGSTQSSHNPHTINNFQPKINKATKPVLGKCSISISRRRKTPTN